MLLSSSKALRWLCFFVPTALRPAAGEKSKSYYAEAVAAGGLLWPWCASISTIDDAAS